MCKLTSPPPWESGGYRSVTATIGLYALPDGRQLERIATGSLPEDMVLLERPIETHEDEGLPITARLFVACANTNDVWVYGLTAGDRVRLFTVVFFSRSKPGPALAPGLPSAYPATLPPPAADRIGVVDFIDGLIVLQGGDEGGEAFALATGVR